MITRLVFVLVALGLSVPMPASAGKTALEPCLSVQELVTSAAIPEAVGAGPFPCSENAAAILSLWKPDRFSPPRRGYFMGRKVARGDGYFLLAKRALASDWWIDDPALAGAVMTISLVELMKTDEPDREKLALWLLYERRLFERAGVFPERFRNSTAGQFHDLGIMRLSRFLAERLGLKFEDLSEISCLVAAERPGADLREAASSAIFRKCRERKK